MAEVERAISQRPWLSERGRVRSFGNRGDRAFWPHRRGRSVGRPGTMHSRGIVMRHRAPGSTPVAHGEVAEPGRFPPPRLVCSILRSSSAHSAATRLHAPDAAPAPPAGAERARSPPSGSGARHARVSPWSRNPRLRHLAGGISSPLPETRAPRCSSSSAPGSMRPC